MEAGSVTLTLPESTAWQWGSEVQLTFTYRALDVPHDETVLIVKELNPHLGYLHNHSSPKPLMEKSVCRVVHRDRSLQQILDGLVVDSTLAIEYGICTLPLVNTHLPSCLFPTRFYAHLPTRSSPPNNLHHNG